MKLGASGNGCPPDSVVLLSQWSKQAKQASSLEGSTLQAQDAALGLHVSNHPPVNFKSLHTLQHGSLGTSAA